MVCFRRPTSFDTQSLRPSEFYFLMFFNSKISGKFLRSKRPSKISNSGCSQNHCVFMHLCRNHISRADGGNLVGWVPDRGEHGVKEQGQVILENMGCLLESFLNLSWSIIVPTNTWPLPSSGWCCVWLQNFWLKTGQLNSKDSVNCSANANQFRLCTGSSVQGQLEWELQCWAGSRAGLPCSSQPPNTLSSPLCLYPAAPFPAVLGRRKGIPALYCFCVLIKKESADLLSAWLMGPRCGHCRPLCLTNLQLLGFHQGCLLFTERNLRQ